jgi:multiple sugar transport system permease protein
VTQGDVRGSGSGLLEVEGPARSRRFDRGGARQEGAGWARVREIPFVLPVVAVVGIGIVVPTITVVLNSFRAWNPGFESPFVGLDNYVQLAKSSAFLQILRNQAFFLVTVLPLGVLAPLVLAVLLHERVPFPGLFRTVYFFPAIVSPAVIGILFSFMLTPDGPLDATLHALGLEGWTRLWLVDPGYVKPVVALIFLWGSIGVGVVIFGAGLSAIPPELLELAELDGPTWWQRFFRVILPSIGHLVVLWIVILLISTFVSMFPWIFTTTRGGPGFASTTLDFDIYRNSLRFGFFGLAAAEVVYLLIIVGVIVGVGAGAFRSRGTAA